MTVPYDVVRDFAPISRVAFLPLVLIKSSQVKAATVADLVTTIKASPGKFNFSSSGKGGAPHLAGELFKIVAGLDMIHVPYNGAGPALTDVAAGTVQLTFTTFTSAQALLKSDRIAAVAVASNRRLAALPQVPTFEESGIHGMEIGTMNGLLAPAKTPPAIVEKIYAALKKASESPEFKAQFVEQGADMLIEPPAQFSAYIKADLPRWKDLIVKSGTKME
jgi:tripartite-type tricarboxylate transporter receptor subunit TctC